MLCKKCQSPSDNDMYLCKDCSERYPFLYVKRDSDLYLMQDKGFKIGSFGLDLVFSKILISEDGKRMFFTLFSSMEKRTLMYYNFQSDENPLGMVADNVVEFRVSEKGDIVYYIDISNTLYFFDFNKTERISDIAFSMHISKDGKYLVYESADSYFLYNHEEKMSGFIDSNIDFVEISPDFNTMLYIKDNTLYRLTKDLEKESIKDGVKEVIYINDNEIYYINLNNELCFYDAKGARSVLDASKTTFIKKICSEKPFLVVTVGLSLNLLVIKDMFLILNMYSLVSGFMFNSSFDKFAFIGTRTAEEDLIYQLFVYDLNKYALDLITEDVVFHSYLPNDQLVYGVWKDSLLELYMDDKKIDEGRFHEVCSDNESNLYYVKTKRINGSIERDLYFYDIKQDKTTLVAEDIIDFYHISKDMIYYYKDNYSTFDVQNYNLYVFDGEKSKLLDFGLRKHLWLDRISHKSGEKYQPAYICGYDIYWIYFGSFL
ncbi:MAG: hypothetical protein GX166_12720 [Clostridiaceae bacterium]|nr:hypothetical protein [Clostridiaceae bacterium]